MGQASQQNRELELEVRALRKQVHRQMRLAGISSARCRATTNSNYSHPIAPSLLMRKFTFHPPDQTWVGDITYIFCRIAAYSALAIFVNLV